MKINYSSLYKHLKFQCKISPNNHYVANIVENRLVIRRHELDLTVKEVYTAQQTLDYLQWSPDSEYVLVVSYEKSRIEVRSMTDPKWKGVIYDEGFPFVRVMWSPDSKNILCFSDLNLRLSIWNLSLKEQKCIDYLKYSDKGFEISPDKKYVAMIEKNNSKEYLGIYQSNSFMLVQRFELETLDAENLKWSPNGMYIAVWENCLYHKLYVYRVDGELFLDYSGDEFGLGIKTVQWNSNSKILALGDYDDMIHLVSADSWKLIGTLPHPSHYSSSSTGPNILEQVKSNKAAIPTRLNTNIEYNQILNRPFQIPTKRPEYNAANPKTGIQSCLFSPSGLYICSKSDTMPTALFIWDLKSLSCLHVVLFQNPIRQFVWQPQQENTVNVICGDRNIHFIDLDNTIELTAKSVPTSDFNIKKIKWNQNGTCCLIMEKDLFCLALMN